MNKKEFARLHVMLMVILTLVSFMVGWIISNLIFD